ncbi:MAG TPA: ribbon-helix-helix domain-containing protein [Candidatus Nanoarchaeia archaeon]|nr:ribbon-helix-helix domain-containing protein [Candidatus Nanoarchaeia archaeon]
MKERISITLDKEIIKEIDLILKNKKFRNRSHFVESAIDLLIKNEKK